MGLVNYSSYINVTEWRKTGNKSSDQCFYQEDDDEDDDEPGFQNIQFAESILMLILNLSTFLLIVKHKRLRKTYSNIFILNLLVAHMLFSISLITLSSLHITSHYDLLSMNVVYFVIDILLMHIFLSLLITTLDRHIAIKYPFEYGKIRNKQVFLVTLSSWMVTIVFTTILLTCHLEQKHLTIVGTCILGIAMVTLISSNVNVYIIARRHAKSIFVQVTVTGREAVKDKKRQLRKTIKSTYVCLSIVFLFLFLWLPYFMYNLMDLIGHGDRTLEVMEELSIKFWVEVVALLYPVTSPIIIVLLRRDIRTELKKSLKRRSRKTFTENSVTGKWTTTNF